MGMPVVKADFEDGGYIRSVNLPIEMISGCRLAMRYNAEPGL